MQENENIECTDRGLGTDLFKKFGSGVQQLAGNVTFGDAVTGVIGKSHADAIRQLLHKAATKAVTKLGSEDGYLRNADVKITLPPKYHTIESIAKKFHLTDHLDQFIVSINRAAEHAALSSLPIFEKFISKLTINQSSKFIASEGSPATDYFKQETENDLRSAYAPIVTNSMEEYSVTHHFNDLRKKIKRIPGLSNLDLDIEKYTITKALAGLFLVLSQQEHKLRQNPSEHFASIVDAIHGKK